MEEIKSITKRLAAVDAQVAFNVLSRSLAFKANWIFQTNEPELTVDAAIQIDLALREAFRLCTNIDTLTCPHDQDNQQFSPPDMKCFDYNDPTANFTFDRIFSPPFSFPYLPQMLPANGPSGRPHTPV